MIVVWLFFAVPGVCLQFVFVVYPDHTHLLRLGYKLLAHAHRQYYHIHQFISSALPEVAYLF